MNNISNDSGLDDSAVAGGVAAQNGGGGGVGAGAVVPTGAATRLSWFLAEVDEGSMKNGIPNGRSRFCVLHSMELLETDVSDKYMTRTVEFRMNGFKLEAKLILAADERKLVDAALLDLSRAQREAEHEATQMLVQYTEEGAAGKRLVQKLMSPHRAVWLSTKSERGVTPMVRLGPGLIAHVLYAYEQRECMEKILLSLKVRCFDHAFDEQLDTEPEALNAQTWMLVQYSPEPEMIVYQVISYKQTVWRQENLYKDVVAYFQLPDNDSVFQAVVMCYGQNEQQMQDKLEQLRTFALELELPLADEVDQQLEEGGGSTASLFGRSNTTLFQRAEQRDSSGEHRLLRSRIELMTEQAETEAAMIIEAFDMVDNINRNLQARQAQNTQAAPSSGA